VAKKSVSRVDRNLARRLREARRESGLSTRMAVLRLPKRFVVSHTTVASYENGTSVPPVDMLAAFADLYARPLNWFLENRESLTDFRYWNIRSRIPVKERHQFQAVVGKWADAYLKLDQHLCTPQRQRLAAPVKAAIELSPHKLAQVVRQSIFEIDDDEPIHSVIKLLESFSAWALEIKASIGIEAAAARYGQKTVIAFNPEISKDRLRMIAAHELAHVLYDDCKQTLGWNERVLGKKAFGFATSLLMPESQLHAAFEGRSFIRLAQHAEKFGIPITAMIYMAESVDIINTTASRWLLAEIRRRGWKSQQHGYVWRDRALTFESMLESAIQTKAITWLDAERITGIRESELRQRLIEVIQPDSVDNTQTTLKIFDSFLSDSEAETG